MVEMDLGLDYRGVGLNSYKERDQKYIKFQIELQIKDFQYKYLY